MTSRVMAFFNILTAPNRSMYRAKNRALSAVPRPNAADASITDWAMLLNDSAISGAMGPMSNELDPITPIQNVKT
ncbi:hypothetical protein Pcaca04_23580 [Pectobacterium carotovorum subsp. carotovorum]|nr:hypothetical protein Pcaca04_23580 [Pectobacterium carotovorum subsp. carotovorum]